MLLTFCKAYCSIVSSKAILALKTKRKSSDIAILLAFIYNNFSYEKAPISLSNHQ